MFQMMGAAPPRRVERGGVKGFILNCYYDPFKWSLVKSIMMFGIGVKVANELVGFDVMTPSA